MNVSEDERPIRVIHSLAKDRGRGSEFASKWHRVRFPTTPPTHRTEDGVSVKLNDDEGWIEVVAEVENGLLSVMVRGSHALRLDPTSANTVLVAMRDAVPERGQ